jgi:hypothetical protein
LSFALTRKVAGWLGTSALGSPSKVSVTAGAAVASSAALVLASGAAERAPLSYGCTLPPELVTQAAALLPEAEAGQGVPIIGLAPGAGARRKCWPLDRYLELARELQRRGLFVHAWLVPVTQLKQMAMQNSNQSSVGVAQASDNTTALYKLDFHFIQRSLIFLQ